jgi:ATP phosphoribosyltransferase
VRLHLAIGAETTRDHLVAAVKEAMQAARDEGVFAGVSRERLDQALDAFSRVRLDQCVDAITRIRAETDPPSLLIDLGRDYRELMATADEFITLTSQFLEGSRKRVETEIAQLEGAGELKAAQHAIAQSLDQLHALTGELAGASAEGGDA